MHSCFSLSSSLSFFSLIAEKENRMVKKERENEREECVVFLTSIWSSSSWSPHFLNDDAKPTFSLPQLVPLLPSSSSPFLKSSLSLSSQFFFSHLLQKEKEGGWEEDENDDDDDEFGRVLWRSVFGWRQISLNFSLLSFFLLYISLHPLSFSSVWPFWESKWHSRWERSSFS